CAVTRHPPTIDGGMKRIPIVALLPLLLCVACMGNARAFRAAPGHSFLPALRSAPRVGESAPHFKLMDTTGRRRSLAEFRGHRVALFVSCGCSWCYAVARGWA